MFFLFLLIFLCFVFIFFFCFFFVLFLFVGSSKSIFWGASISLRFLFTFLVKKIQFFGPSREMQRVLLFFHPFFFSPFSFPLFSFFSWILFFFFFCLLYFLAFVSRFNKRCFLRSRCSMEMWCLDDIGRDSWDWIGPPVWERACFNSPEWAKSSSPVKMEPPDCIIGCWLLSLSLSLSLSLFLSLFLFLFQAHVNGTRCVRPQPATD